MISFALRMGFVYKILTPPYFEILSRPLVHINKLHLHSNDATEHAALLYLHFLCCIICYLQINTQII